MKIRLKSGFKSRLREHFDSQNCVHNFHSQAKFSLNLFFSEKFSLKQKILVQVFNFRNFKYFFKEFKREYLNLMRSYFFQMLKFENKQLKKLLQCYLQHTWDKVMVCIFHLSSNICIFHATAE